MGPHSGVWRRLAHLLRHRPHPAWHIREDLLTESKYIDPYKLAPVGRLGGPRYSHTHDIFEMVPPDVQPDRDKPKIQSLGQIRS